MPENIERMRSERERKMGRAAVDFIKAICRGDDNQASASAAMLAKYGATAPGVVPLPEARCRYPVCAGQKTGDCITCPATSQTLVRRLSEACSGRPHAKIACPHGLLHDAKNELERMQRVLDLIASPNDEMMESVQFYPGPWTEQGLRTNLRIILNQACMHAEAPNDSD